MEVQLYVCNKYRETETEIQIKREIETIATMRTIATTETTATTEMIATTETTATTDIEITALNKTISSYRERHQARTYRIPGVIFYLFSVQFFSQNESVISII